MPQFSPPRPEVVADYEAELGPLTDAQKASYGLLGEECDEPLWHGLPSLTCIKCREPPGMECGDGIRFELNETLLEIMQDKMEYWTNPNRTINETNAKNLTNHTWRIPHYPVEYCDDMNTGHGDGCSATCVMSAVYSGGGTIPVSSGRGPVSRYPSRL